MVLCLKARESRSPPGLPIHPVISVPPVGFPRIRVPSTGEPTTTTDAGWSSPVARQAHNLKVTGSNPVPATRIPHEINGICSSLEALSMGPLVVSPPSQARVHRLRSIASRSVGGPSLCCQTVPDKGSRSQIGPENAREQRGHRDGRHSNKPFQRGMARRERTDNLLRSPASLETNEPCLAYPASSRADK